MHRAELEQAGEAVGRARVEERALRARRDQVAQRVAASQAALDSLRAKGPAR